LILFIHPNKLGTDEPTDKLFERAVQGLRSNEYNSVPLPNKY